VWRYLDEIDRRGGMVRAIAEGYPQREIADAAYRFQRELDAGERRQNPRMMAAEMAHADHRDSQAHKCNRVCSSSRCRDFVAKRL